MEKLRQDNNANHHQIWNDTDSETMKILEATQRLQNEIRRKMQKTVGQGD